MKVEVNCMLVKKCKATKEDGTALYYGNFLDKESGASFNLYFNDYKLLDSMSEFEDYMIPVYFTLKVYTLQNGYRVNAWKINLDEEALK